MDKKRTFILGLGHQKCGTSWLHKYLCHSDQFAEGYSKEFHVWDRKDIPLFAIKKFVPAQEHLLAANGTSVIVWRLQPTITFHTSIS